MKYWLLLSLSLLLSYRIVAQQPAAQNATYVNAALAELKKRGLSEDEVRQRLKERGIDIDNVKPEELPRLQKQIEEILSELEREKQAKADKLAAQRDSTEAADADQVPPKTAKKTRKKVEQVLDETDQTDEDAAAEPAKKTKTTKANPNVGETDPSVVDPKNGVKTGQKPKKKSNSVEKTVGTKPRDEADDTVPKAKIYGQDVFRTGKLELRTAKDFKASDTYVLGDGDRVTVSISGAAFYNSTLTVKADGSVEP